MYMCCCECLHLLNTFSGVRRHPPPVPPAAPFLMLLIPMKQCPCSQVPK